MNETAYPGPFAPDNPLRRLPWVLAIALLLVLIAMAGLGRVLHPPAPQPVAAPRPLQARIYELPASRGAGAAIPAPRAGHATPPHHGIASQPARVAHGQRGVHVSIPPLTRSAAGTMAQASHPRQSGPASSVQAAMPPRPPAFNWATLQSQINAAVSQSDPSRPQIHDPHTLVARYYLASILEKLQRIGDMNDPTSLTGMPVIRLVIGSHGELQRLSLLRSSGNDQLDHDALQIARESAPFAPFPDKLRHQTQHIEVVCYMKFVGYRQLYTDY